MLAVNRSLQCLVTTDSFLYAIHQAYQARRSAAGFRSHLRYEPFLLGNWHPPQEKSQEELLKEWSAILKHHYHALPHYLKQEDITLENVAWFAQSIATLLADANELLQNYEKGSLTEDLETPETASLRTELLSEIKKQWGPYASFVLSYLEWGRHKSFPPLTEAIDWRLRPPCGEAYAKAFPQLLEEKRLERRRANGASKNGSSSKEPRFPTERKRGEEGRKDAFEQPRGQAKHAGGGVHQRPASHEQGEVRKHPQRDAALQEALQAVEEMKSNPSLAHWDLPPRNGFLRREQHLIIAQAGFHTESSGEDQERCVRIVRKP